MYNGRKQQISLSQQLEMASLYFSLSLQQKIIVQIYELLDQSLLPKLRSCSLHKFTSTQVLIYYGIFTFSTIQNINMFVNRARSLRHK